MLDIRPVLYLNGFLLLILALAMTLPAAADLAAGLHAAAHGADLAAGLHAVTHAGGGLKVELKAGLHALGDGAVENAVANAVRAAAHSGGPREWPAFIGGAFCATLAGLALILGNRGQGRRSLQTRETFLLTVISWILVSLLGAIPFALSSLKMSPTDAIFESVSGLTTTGATVLHGLDSAPHAILIWRAMLNWLGGIAIILTAVTLLPTLRIGGMQMFRMESSDKAERVKPRFGQVAWGVLGVYSLFTFILTGALLTAGMTPLQALCHAMSSLSTGGFSTSDLSLGAFGDGARWICMIGMIAGACSFNLYIAPWKRGQWAILKDSQVRWYLLTMLTFAVILTFWNWAVRNMGAYEAFRTSFFNVTAVLTTTGYHTNDYDNWGGFSEIVFFMLTFVGGCTGSAAGGIKVFRFEVLFAMVRVHARRLLHPHGVFPIRFNEMPVSNLVVRSVLSFVMFYFFAFAGLSVLLTMTGLDGLSSLSAAAAALGNVGPGLGRIVGPGHDYGALSDAAKWLLAAGMMLGRLEVATVAILFFPGFWRE